MRQWQEAFEAVQGDGPGRDRFPTETKKKLEKLKWRLCGRAPGHRGSWEIWQKASSYLCLHQMVTPYFRCCLNIWILCHLHLLPPIARMKCCVRAVIHSRINFRKEKKKKKSIQWDSSSCLYFLLFSHCYLSCYGKSKPSWEFCQSALQSLFDLEFCTTYN